MEVKKKENKEAEKASNQTKSNVSRPNIPRRYLIFIYDKVYIGEKDYAKKIIYEYR